MDFTLKPLRRRVGKTIVVSGTPGVGKTTVSVGLSRFFSLEYYSISELLISKRVYTHFDDEYRSYIIDEEKAKEVIKSNLKDKRAVVETIYPSLLKGLEIDLVLVLRRNPVELYKALKSKNWSESKIRENVEAEFLGIVYEESKELVENPCQMNATGLWGEKLVDKAIKLIIKNNECEEVNWFNSENIDEILRILSETS